MAVRNDVSRPFATLQLAEREGPGALRRIVYPFRQAVAPGVTQTLIQKVPRDGTVEQMRIRIYPGAELAVHIVPYVVNAREERRDLLTYIKGGKKFVDGDDDTFSFSIREPVFSNDGDKIIVETTNILDPAALNGDGTVKYPAASYTYDWAVDIEVDYAAGPWPIMVVKTDG
jgi:hypothetical protein